MGGRRGSATGRETRVRVPGTVHIRCFLYRHVCRPFVDLLQSLFADWRRSIETSHWMIFLGWAQKPASLLRCAACRRSWMRDWGCGCSTKWAGSRIPTKSMRESLEMWPTSCALSSFLAWSDGPRSPYSVASFALEN